jgi:hypothetical protein
MVTPKAGPKSELLFNIGLRLCTKRKAREKKVSAHVKKIKVPAWLDSSNLKLLFLVGYNNGYGRFSRENPASLQSDRRQSTSSGYQTYQWNQQRPVGRGMYRAQRGRQWVS